MDFLKDLKEDEMKTVCKFIIAKFMQDIERNPNKESFIEFRPLRDSRTPHPLNYDFHKCNDFVDVKWSTDLFPGLYITFGSFIVRSDEKNNSIYSAIAPVTEKLVESYRKEKKIERAYPFPKDSLTM